MTMQYGDMYGGPRQRPTGAPVPNLNVQPSLSSMFPALTQGNYGHGAGQVRLDPYAAFTAPRPDLPIRHSTGSFWGDLKRAPGVGLVPGLGTAATWSDSGPWGRGFNLGMDAIDLATLMGSKPFTTSLRAGARGTAKFLARNDPKMVYVRSGNIPTNEEHLGLQAGMGWMPYPQGTPLHSYNYLTGMREPGISTYQALKVPSSMNVSPFDIPRIQFPNEFSSPGQQTDYTYLLKSMPNVPLKGIIPETSLTMAQYAGQPFRNNPYKSQMDLIYNSRRPVYEISGSPVAGRFGGDLEPVIDPDTARYAINNNPTRSEIIPSRQITPYNLDYNNPYTVADVILPASTGNLTLTQKVLSNLPPWVSKYGKPRPMDVRAEFARYDASGNLINAPWYDRPFENTFYPMQSVGTSLPFTTTGRAGVNYSR